MHIVQQLWVTGHYNDIFVEYMLPVNIFPAQSRQYLAASNATLMRLDIVVERDGEFVPIELKFKTRQLQNNITLLRFGVPVAGFNLTNQSAQDLGRYDFWRDVKRLEVVKSAFLAVVGGVEFPAVAGGVKFPVVAGGIALFVTNDHSYTRDPRATSNSYNFSLCHGIAWRKKCWLNNKAKTAVGRPNIVMNGQYSVRPWQPSSIGQINGTAISPDFCFTYTIV